MRPHEQPRQGGTRLGWCAWVAGALGAVSAAILFTPSQSPWQGEDATPPEDPQVCQWEQPIIARPPVWPAGSAAWDALEGDALVAGVTVGGHHRAYLLAALAPIAGHVVNDRVGGAPVVVTYCERTDCLRVYAGPTGGPDLGAAVERWDGRPGEEGLLMRVGPHVYRQDTGASPGGGDSFPYPATAVERTTWDRWRRAHPDTDLYDRVPQGD